MNPFRFSLRRNHRRSHGRFFPYHRHVPSRHDKCTSCHSTQTSFDFVCNYCYPLLIGSQTHRKVYLLVSEKNDRCTGVFVVFNEGRHLRHHEGNREKILAVSKILRTCHEHVQILFDIHVMIYPTIWVIPTLSRVSLVV